MTDTLRRRCESALTHPVTLAPRLAMIIAIIAGASMVACESVTNLGATRLARTADGVAVETLRTSRGFDAVIYESLDGGLTWHVESTGYGSGNFKWGESWVVTPRGEYRIEGPDVVRISVGNSATETVYSGEHLQGHSYKWIQAKQSTLQGEAVFSVRQSFFESDHEFSLQEVSLQPYSIVYDRSSGNLLASMGIQGVLIGKPDGSWTPMAVGPFAPADFSRWARVRTLLSIPEFWGTALSFPLSMIALSMLTTRLRQERPLPLEFMLVSLGILFLSIASSLIWLMGLASYSNDELFVFTNAFLSAILVPSAFVFALQKRWFKAWRSVVGSLLAMMVLVVLTFVVWLELGGPFGFAALAMILLCALPTRDLARVLMRRQQQWSVSWSRI